ncbi:MAG TPA: leucyl/phenylalanyl-tRNA--protein transferase [Spirochaetia bacterium]|nr:leucyl/phenylalanyl-tRNA--protein transferase [Spirochaetia bacterium]
MSPDFPYLDEHTSFRFPRVNTASEEGIVAVGGNLSPGMLLSAYRQGLFPWYSEGEPILWWSPDPRFILFPGELHVSKRMQRLLRKGAFRISFDTAFGEVITACSTAPRPGQKGTWITKEVIEGYNRLHQLGYAHSVEAWNEDGIAGGLYGIWLGSIFFGESMFSRVPNASKSALVALVSLLEGQDLKFVDCQYYTPHLESLGAKNVPRDEFMGLLHEGLKGETTQGSWRNLRTATSENR